MFRKHMQKILLILLTLRLCILPAQASAAGDLIDPNQQIQEEVVYQTAQVYRGTFIRETTFQATEFNPYRWDISVEQSNVVLESYAVSNGDQVQAGDVLLQYRVETDDITLSRLERELARMQDELAAAISVGQREIALTQDAAEHAQDPFEKEQLQITAAMLQIQLERLCYEQNRAIEEKQQSVAEYREDQQIKTLTAPANGVVTNLVVKNPGDAIAAGEVLMTLVCTDIRLLAVNDPDTELRYNMQVSVAIGKGDKQTVITGRVVAAENSIPQEYRKGRAYILLDPGFENVNLQNVRVIANKVQIDNVLLVNRKAVIQENGKFYITKLSDGVLQRRGVHVGVSNLTDIWILTGVAEGDTVVLQ